MIVAASAIALNVNPRLFVVAAERFDPKNRATAITPNIHIQPLIEAGTKVPLNINHSRPLGVLNHLSFFILIILKLIYRP